MYVIGTKPISISPQRGWKREKWTDRPKGQSDQGQTSEHGFDKRLLLTQSHEMGVKRLTSTKNEHRDLTWNNEWRTSAREWINETSTVFHWAVGVSVEIRGSGSSELVGVDFSSSSIVVVVGRWSKGPVIAITHTNLALSCFLSCYVLTAVLRAKNKLLEQRRFIILTLPIKAETISLEGHVSSKDIRSRTFQTMEEFSLKWRKPLLELSWIINENQALV